LTETIDSMKRDLLRWGLRPDGRRSRMRRLVRYSVIGVALAVAGALAPALPAGATNGVHAVLKVSGSTDPGETSTPPGS
jgi:hypothetical protein